MLLIKIQNLQLFSDYRGTHHTDMITVHAPKSEYRSFGQLEQIISTEAI